MDVHLITDAGVSTCTVEDVPELLERREGLVWVDIPRVDQEAHRLLAEVCRCLRPGGVLVGSDTLPSLRFRLYHLADTMVVVDPDRLPARLEAAGFDQPRVGTRAGRLRFRARRPDGHIPR